MAPAASAILLTPFVIKHLGVDRYGLYILAIGLLSFLGSFDGGLAASAGRFFSLHIGAQHNSRATRLLVSLATICVVLGTVAAAVFTWVSGWVTNVFQIPAGLSLESVYLLRAMAIVTVLGVVRSLLASFVNAHQRYEWTSMSYIVGYIAYAIGLLALLPRGGDLRTVALILVAQATWGVASLLPPAIGLAKLDGAVLASRGELAEYASYAWKIQVTGLAGLANVQLPALVIARVLPISQVGIFNLGANFSTQLRLVPTNALRATVSHLGHHFGERGWAACPEFAALQRSWVRGVTGWFAVGLGAAYVGITAWVGDQFERAAIVAIILLVGNGVVLLSGTLLVWLQVTGYPGIEARYSILSVSVNLCLSLALIRPFGIIGVAVAILAAQLVSTTYLTWSAGRKLPVSPPLFWRDVPVVPALAAGILTLVVEMVARPTLPHGGAGLLTAGVCAAPGLILYGCLIFGFSTVHRWLVARARRALRISRSGGPRHRADQGR